MVFLGPKDGQIEVRLVKPPFDAADTDRVYIDEYEKLGTPHQEKGSFEYYRYTASKDTTYGIEITLKKGFSWGQFLGIKVVVHDKARNVRIGFRECPKTGWGENLLDTDKRLMVNSLDGVIIGGKRKDDVNLSFRVLATDEDLKLETNVPGIEPSDLGGFKIEVYRYGERNYEELPNSRHEENLREYQARLATRASMVDEKSFTKHGITHNIELEGGVERQLKPPSKYQFLHSYSKEVYFHYFCRSLDFLEENSFHKCPIPMEFQPWDSLKDHERQSCFKALQTYDKEALLKYTIAEAAPGADVKAIQRQLLELGHIPNHWRGWGQLYTRERQKHFEYLQVMLPRVNDCQPADVSSVVEKTGREIPPEERKQELDVKPPTAPAVSRTSIKEESVDTLAQLPHTPVPQTTIKEEPVEAPVFPKAKKMQSEVIILDDTPPRPSKRTATNVLSIPASTIKSEPIDLDALPSLASTCNNTSTDGAPAKRIKLEAGVQSVTIDDDEELLRLKEEEDLLDQELQAIQRMAQLIREKKEQKKKIATLEAKTGANPGRGSRS